MIRVFIVDDHPLVIEGIRSMLLQLPEIEIAGHAMTGSSCLGYFVNGTADLILLDINLPDQSGVDVCRALLKRKPELKVISLTNFDQLTYLQNMKDAGARGYLLKNSSLDEIEKAIHTVMAGKEYWLGKETVRGTLSKQHPLISRREIEVLKLIAQGLTNQEIADKLFVSVSTIDSHRKNLISKLNVNNTAALVRAALENKII